jgi:hypothetical protein
MATSGLSRRRVGGASNVDGDDDGASPAPTAPTTPTGTERRKQAGGNAFEGGDRVAFDARDMDLSDEAREGGKMPRLTIMEEVLLLGLKDRAVRLCIAFASYTCFLHAYLCFVFSALFRHDLLRSAAAAHSHTHHTALMNTPGLPLFLERQHILCPAWMHPHRARPTKANRPGQGPKPAATTPRRADGGSH